MAEKEKGMMRRKRMRTRGRWKIPATALKATGNVRKSCEKGAGFRTQVRNAENGKVTGG